MKCRICLPVIPDAVGALFASLINLGKLRQIFFGDMSDRLTKISALENKAEIQNILCLFAGHADNLVAEAREAVENFPRCRASPVLHGLASCCSRISVPAPAR